jgi:TP901 family phage tail tape measure protein
MAVQINVAANQAALTASIQAGVQAYNQKFAQNNQVNLSVNQRAFSQPLGRMTGDVKDFEAALAASNARVIAFGASTAVLGGVIRSFKELANVTIDVEKNLADINRVFGLTTSQLQKFSTDLFSVGKQTASSFDDASKAALEFSRQGLKAEEVLIRTKDALTLARVAGISTANSVDALTSTVNGFAATGVTTSQILNKLVAVEQDFAVGAGDLAEALSRTGQAAQEAGVSLDQLNALVTAAQQSTARGGAVIGNALKTIFTRLQRTETLDQLEAFNIAVRDVQGNTLPAVTVLQNFAGAYKNLGDAQRAQLSEQVAGVYQVNILKAIVGDLNKSQGVYAGALQRGASATNEAEVATAKLNQTLDALLKQTATSTQQLANNIGKVTFEPLARYGTEQLKSLVESMNEILEGEGVGSTFANGLLKGIRNVIAGPGAIAAFFTLFKLIQNSFTYLAQALPQIAGITTETQNRKNIEQSILQIMQQQGPVSQALAGSMGNQAAQAQLLLQLARQQTAEYQIQSTLAKQLATQLAGQGVRVKGSGGLQVTRAGGYIPNATRMAEAVGAQTGGYAPGKVVKSPVGGVMNTAEDVKYVPGFAQPFINPPAGSKAGRAHRQNAISRTGVDPYMNSGFIPNFANTKYFNKNKDTLTLNATEKKPFVIPENQELAAVADINKDSVYGLQYKIKLAGSYSRFSGAFDKKMLDSKQADTILLFSSLQSDQRKTFIENYKKYVSSKEDFQVKPFTANKKETINFSKQLQGVKSDTLGNLYELYLQKKFNLEKNPNQNAISDLDFVDAEAKIGDFSSANLLSKAIRDNAEKKGIERPYYKNGKYNKINLNDKALTLYTTNASKGFIPNFAPPTSAIRIPWFKKFGNAAFDKIQPTLGISKASDVDTFRQIGFRSTAKGADKVGDSNIFAPLYEDFVFKALQLTSQSKIKDQLIRGYVNQPGTDQKQSAYDAFLGDVAFEKKGFPKGNLTGSISQNLNDKFERYAKANPAGAAKIKESVMVFNESGHENQLPSEFGKNFLSLAGTSYSQMLKNSPDLVKGLSAETNSLLNNYVKDPAFLAMNAAKGFVPNFASMISSSIKGKGNISAIKTGKNNYEIEGVEVGKKFRGQGLGSQLYGSIAQKIGSGSTIKSVLLPQEQALADYASGKSIPAKAIFPQLSWAKMAKSSKLLINGKEIAMSDFENGIAGHKYNAAKLDMALIELVNSHASGFIPNFAYKQAVMGLEESMSGEKAVFDNKPFPHIRNKSQPTFSSAIADHGGLGNALSDSMRGQKNAGLMSKGYIPNFGTVNPNAAFGVGGLGALTQAETLQFNKLNAALSKLETDTTLTASQMKALKTSIRLEARSLSASTGIIDIVTETNKALAVSIRQNITAQRASTSANAPTPSLAQRLLGARGERADKFAGSKLGGIAGVVGGALIGGQLESFIQGGRDRSQLSTAEKFASSASSGVLTATTTGAEIGSMIPGLGTAAGAAIGALIGLGKAAYDSQESLQDLQKSSEFYKTQVDNIISSSGSYIQQLKELSSISDPSLLNQASFKLSETFQNLSKESPELGRKFMEAGGDIDKMGKAIEDFTSTANMVKSINNLKTSYKESGDKLSFTIPVRSNQLAKKGYNIQQGSGDIKETEASLQTSFVQFQGFFDLLKKGGLTAENSSAFMEEFQKEMQGYTSESDLAAIAKKYNISETIAKELADLSDNVIDEMGVEGDFFVANSGVLVKRFFDATNDKYKSAAQQVEKQQFNARPIIKRIEDSISNYVFNIASQLQTMEFESSRFKILENAANDYLDSISTPLEKASREISSRNRETQTKTEASRMKFTSDFEQNIGSKLPKALGGSDAGMLGKLETLIESFKTSSPEQQLSQINELIKNTNSVEATSAAGYKNVDPNEVKSLNIDLKKERDSLMSLIQAKKENISLTTLENDVAKRKAESTERLLILQNKLIESDTKRAISIAGQKANIDIRENDLQNTRKTPGFGFGVSEGRINRETIMQNRGLMMERQSLTRADTLGNVKSQLKSTLFPILTPIKTAFQEIEKVSISEQPNLYKNLGVDKVNISDMTDLFNLDDMLDKINDPASLESFRKNLEYIFSNIDQTSVLYKPLQEQMGIISQTLIGLDKESKIFESNSQADIKIADVNDRINNAYIFRLNTLLQIEKAQRGILNTIEIEEQRLDAAKSRPANFFGLGVTGKAEKQIGFDEQNLALRQRRQNAQATQNVQQQLSQFETYRSKIKAESINPLLQEGSYGPLNKEQTDRAEKARTAIANLDTSKVTNVDQAKAFVSELSNIRNQYGLQGEAAKTLADTEKEINSILNSNVDELHKMRSIQDILNGKVRQEAKDRQSIRMGFKEGFDQIQDDADTGLNKLAKDTPILFRDGMVSAIKATIREADNLESALMGIASNFLDTISTQLMNTGVSKIISGSGLGSIFGAQTGGYIRAQSGTYISGTGTGDKYPAMLENGEYVLNRRAVMAMGGPAALDTLNFSAAPRFASGGAFSKEFNDISSMENNMTQMGLENDPYYNELNDAAKQKAAEDRAKKLADKQQKAAMIGSLVAAAATIAIGAGISNVAQNMQATKTQALSGKLTSGAELTKAESMSIRPLMNKGLLSSTGQYTGGTPNTGFKSIFSGPLQSGQLPFYQRGSMNPFAPKKAGKQTGGLIGSRLSDTIPGYMEGGLYDSPMVKRYGTGMQSGGSPISSAGNSNSTVNNNTSANNSFNFNTSVQRDGSLKMGSNTTSYEQQDVELSKNLNNKIYAAVGEVIRKEKQFGGSLAGARNS